MAFTYGGLIGPAVVNNGGSGTTQTYTVNTTVPVGALITLFVTKSVAMATATATDSKGNTWTQRQANTEPVDSQSIIMLECIVTTQLVSGDTVTVTVGGTFSVRLLVAPYFTAAGAITFGSANQADSTFPHQTKSAGSLTGVTGNLVVAGWVENSTDTWTAGAGYTGLTKVEDTGGISSLFAEYDLDGTNGTFSPGATVTTGSSSAGIGARYVETPPPATAAGQYGWGTYGAGDYGSNFGGTSSTPITGSETYTLTEGASGLTVAISTTDAAALSDASALAQSLAVAASESHTQSEGATSLANALATTESGTLSDASALSQQLAVSASDSDTMSDASSLAPAVAAAETHTQTDASTPSATINTTESGTFSDVSALVQQVAVAVSDAGAFSEVSAIANAIAVTDSAALSEATAALTQMLTALDSGTLSELSAVATTLATTDSLTQSEVSGLANALATTDSGTFTDASALLTTVAQAASDAATLGEVSSYGADLSRVDAGAFTDISALASAFSVADSWTFAEAASADPSVPTFISVVTDFAISESFVEFPSLPAGVTAGDFLLCCIGARGSNLTTVTPVDTNWFLIRSQPRNVSGILTMWGRFVQPSDTASLRFDVATAGVPVNDIHLGAILSYSGIHPTIPLTGIPDSNTSTSGVSSVGSKAITTDAPDAVVVRFVHDAVTTAAGNTHTWAGFSTERVDIKQNTAGASPSTGLAVADKAQPTPGSTGTETINIAGNPATAATITAALRSAFTTNALNVTESSSFDDTSAMSALADVLDTTSLAEAITIGAASAVIDAATQSEASSPGVAHARTDAFGLTESASQTSLQLIAVTDSFSFTDDAVRFTFSAVPTIKNPTKADIAYNALGAAVGAKLFGADVVLRDSTVTLNERDGTVTLQAVNYDAEVDPKTGTASVTSKLGSVTLSYNGNG